MHHGDSNSWRLNLCKLSPRVMFSVISYFSCWYDSTVEVLEVNLGWIDEELLCALKSSSDNWLSVFLSLHPSGAASSSDPWQLSQKREHFENACSHYMLLCFQNSTSGALPWVGWSKHSHGPVVLPSHHGKGCYYLLKTVSSPSQKGISLGTVTFQ